MRVDCDPSCVHEKIEKYKSATSDVCLPDGKLFGDYCGIANRDGNIILKKEKSKLPVQAWYGVKMLRCTLKLPDTGD